MPTFITLLQWTQKGIENVKEGPSRLDQAREALKAVGGELKAYYLTLGEYDGSKRPGSIAIGTVSGASPHPLPNVFVIVWSAVASWETFWPLTVTVFW